MELLKNIYFIQEHTPRNLLDFLSEGQIVVGEFCCPTIHGCRKSSGLLSVYIPVNIGAPTTDSKSSSRLATSYQDLRNRDKYSLVLHHSLKFDRIDSVSSFIIYFEFLELKEIEFDWLELL